MKSIRTKIFVMVGGVAILAMLISSFVIINRVMDIVVEDEANIADITTKSVALQIDEYFTKYITIANQMAVDDNVRQTLSNVSSRETFAQLPYYNGAYKMLEKTMASDTKNILSAFVASVNTDVAFDGGDWVADAGFDLTSRSYWFSTQEDIDKGYIITEPYQDIDTGSMVITVSVPIYDMLDKNLVGIAGIDVTIDDLSNMVVNAETSYSEEGAHIMLLSQANEILASENKDYILKTIDKIGFSDNVIDEVIARNGKVFEFNDNGNKYFGMVNGTRDVDWKVLLAVKDDQFMESANQTKRDIMVVYIISIVILVLAVMLVSKSIVAPLRKLTKITDELAKGNLDTVVDIKSSDETGKLADSMRSLVVRLREYIDYIDEVSAALDEFAEGRLEIELKQAYDGEFTKLKGSLMEVSNVFKTTIGQIVETSERVASGSGEIANAAQMLAQGATNQASTTQELTATINELSERVDMNANHAISASEQVRTVGSAADQSNIQMREMMTAIAEINDKSAEIGKIIKVIEDIAFQTNILALNAAVEAARAGSAGKGFAVVADEVRNLASKSAEAAKNTTHLIEESIKAVENGTQIANKTGERLGEVIEGVSETVRLINEISEASVGQASALKQTLEGVEQISSVVQTNAATAEESSAASDELSKQANALQGVASHFKL